MNPSPSLTACFSWILLLAAPLIHAAELPIQFLADYHTVLVDHPAAGGAISAQLESYRHSLEKLEEDWRGDSLEAARLRNDYGLLLGGLGRYVEAEKQYRRSLHSMEAALDAPPELPKTLNNLALLYNSMARYDESELIHQRALAIKEEMFGKESRTMVISLNNLSEFYKGRGLLDQAAQANQEALAIIGRHAVEEEFSDPLVRGPLLNNLGEIHLLKGRYAEAEELFTRALTVLEAAPAYQATPLQNLGRLQREAGRYAEAEAFYRQALQLRQIHLGGSHPDIAESLDALSDLERLKGNYDDALALQLQALEMRGRFFGESHPTLAKSFNSLAILDRIRGNPAAAEANYRKALDSLEDFFGTDHASVATVLYNLGELYRLQGRMEEAKAHFGEALAIQLKLFGQDHPNTAIMAGSLGSPDLPASSGSPYQAAASTGAIGRLSQAAGNPIDAIEFYRQAIALKEEALGSSHPEVADLLDELGGAYQDRERYGEAEDAYRQALRIREEAFGPEHPLIATSLAKLARVARLRQQDAAAIETLYQKATAILDAHTEGDPEELADLLQDTADFYRETDQPEKVLPVLHRLLAIKEKILGAGHPDLNPILQQLQEYLISLKPGTASGDPSSGKGDTPDDIEHFQRVRTGQVHPIIRK